MGLFAITVGMGMGNGSMQSGRSERRDYMKLKGRQEILGRLG